MYIITKIVSSNPAHVEVYSIQHNVIKFVSDLRQVDGFLWVLQLPQPIKLTPRYITEILLKVARQVKHLYSHINHTLQSYRSV